MRSETKTHFSLICLLIAGLTVFTACRKEVGPSIGQIEYPKSLPCEPIDGVPCVQLILEERLMGGVAESYISSTGEIFISTIYTSTEVSSFSFGRLEYFAKDTWEAECRLSLEEGPFSTSEMKRSGSGEFEMAVGALRVRSYNVNSCSENPVSVQLSELEEYPEFTGQSILEISHMDGVQVICGRGISTNFQSETFVAVIKEGELKHYRSFPGFSYIYGITQISKNLVGVVFGDYNKVDSLFVLNEKLDIVKVLGVQKDLNKSYSNLKLYSVQGVDGKPAGAFIYMSIVNTSTPEYQVIKINHLGEQVWDKVINPQADLGDYSKFYVESIFGPARNGGFIIGRTVNYKLGIDLFDADGNQIGKPYIMRPTFNREFTNQRIRQAVDGQIIVVGTGSMAEGNYRGVSIGRFTPEL